MSLTLKCDRCQTVLDEDLTDGAVKFRNTLTGKRFDLCQTCIEATAAFINQARVEPKRTPRPAECFEGEDIYRWLLAEANWLVGGIHKAQHQIRILEDWSQKGYLSTDEPFEHDSVQRDCNLGRLTSGSPPESLKTQLLLDKRKGPQQDS